MKHFQLDSFPARSILNFSSNHPNNGLKRIKLFTKDNKIPRSEGWLLG